MAGALFMAPAIVQASSIMRISPIRELPFGWRIIGAELYGYSRELGIVARNRTGTMRRSVITGCTPRLDPYMRDEAYTQCIQYLSDWINWEHQGKAQIAALAADHGITL